ncbi:MAG: aldehyde ferredoxin oxidoreductase family protein [Methanobacteriota archaeon]
MSGGYMGKCIEVDLTKGTSEPMGLDRSRLEKWVGGKGLGISLLLEMDRSEDPLDAANPLIFLTGPLTGSGVQTSARSCLVTRSPLTGGFLDSHAGGLFGAWFKRTGHDYMIVKGASSKPVYIRLAKDGAAIEDASELWGKGCIETEDILKEKHSGAKVAAIGPAGENKVRFACITADYSRNYGRGGAGAVMGSKNLKAVVVQGSEPIGYHDPARFKALSAEMAKNIAEHPSKKRRYELGTMMWVRMGQEIGGFLPTKNFKHGQWDEYEKITAEATGKALAWEHCGCFGCRIQCSKRAKWDGKMIEGPEYETAAYLGSGCLINDPKAIAEANWLCNDLGLDTISAGVTISFAMEAAEKGLLDKEDNESIRWGSPQAVYDLLGKIARRDGIGNVLAEGTRRASAKIGKGSDYFAIQIAGMELSGVNPLGSYSMLLSLATADFASHTRFWSCSDEMASKLKIDSLAKYIADGQDEVCARNSLIVCDFLPYGFAELAPFLEAATGSPATKDSLQTLGQRISALARLYNLRTGRTHADDLAIPGRFLSEASVSGLMKGRKVAPETFERHVAEIFEARGWDAEGRPTQETLERLGIDV